MILLEAGGNQLVSQLAEDMAHDQINRASSTTVGARFREQLRDLIARLDQCGPHLPLSLSPCTADSVPNATFMCACQAAMHHLVD